jgi:hypothetical protein
MPTTATRIIVSAKTGQSYTETYEIPDPTPEEIAEQVARQKAEMIKRYEQAVQAHLDATAKAYGYNDIVSACSYAAAENKYQSEGQALLAWRAACWETCFIIFADIEAGAEAPTEAGLVDMLPVYP